jgi:hypothetical protein
MSILIHSSSIYKQFLINQFNKETNSTYSNLPKELCDIIKSYCFYDTLSYQILCNIARYKVNICDIINEHVINNEQLFIDYVEDDESTVILDHATIIYTIQKYNPILHDFYFSMNNIIDLCKKCGNYITCKTPNISNYARCTC